MIKQKIFVNRFIPEQPWSQNIMGKIIYAEDELEEWQRENIDKIDIVNIAKHYVGVSGKVEISVFYREK